MAPANIIDWLLKEKRKADKSNKTPDSEPKLSLETAAQSRGESDQIEAKESSSDQIKRVVAEIGGRPINGFTSKSRRRNRSEQKDDG